jgi:hypothetical protein
MKSLGDGFLTDFPFFTVVKAAYGLVKSTISFEGEYSRNSVLVYLFYLPFRLLSCVLTL